jgi:hypothetical protein
MNAFSNRWIWEFSTVASYHFKLQLPPARSICRAVPIMLLPHYYT